MCVCVCSHSTTKVDHSDQNRHTLRCLEINQSIKASKRSAAQSHRREEGSQWSGRFHTHPPASTRRLNMESWRHEAECRSEVCLKRLITERIQDDDSDENVSRMMDESREGRGGSAADHGGAEHEKKDGWSSATLRCWLQNCYRAKRQERDLELQQPVITAGNLFRSFKCECLTGGTDSRRGDDCEIKTSAKTDVESERRGGSAEGT